MTLRKSESLQRNWQTRRELENLGYSPPSSDDEFSNQKDVVSLNLDQDEVSRFAFRDKKNFQDEQEEEVFALSSGGNSGEGKTKKNKKKTVGFSLEDGDDEIEGEEEKKKKKKEFKRNRVELDLKKKGRFSKPDILGDEEKEEEDVDVDSKSEDSYKGESKDSGSDDQDDGESWGKSYHLENASHKDSRLKSEKKRKGKSKKGSKGKGGKDSSEESEGEKERNYLKEVLRIQKERRKMLMEQDFKPPGLWDIWGDEDQVKEPELPMQLDRADLIAKILDKSPLTLALVDDYQIKLLDFEKLKNSLSDQNQSSPSTLTDSPSTGIDQIFHIHFQMLSTYLMNLSFYFYILCEPTITKSDFQDLQSKVLKRLLEFAKVLKTMEELELIGDKDKDDDMELASGIWDMDNDMNELWKVDQNDSDEDDDRVGIMADGKESMITDEELEELGDLEDGELLALLEEAREDSESVNSLNGKKKEGKGKKSKEKSSKAIGSVEEEKKRSKVKFQSGVNGGLDDPLYLDDEDLLSFQEQQQADMQMKNSAEKSDSTLDEDDESRRPKKRRKKVTIEEFSNNDFLEIPSSSSSKASTSKRHTLRFHTSQIEAKSKKRKGIYGGDEDLPIKKSKGERRAEELRKQKHGEDGGKDADLDGADFGEDDFETAKLVRGEMDDFDMSMEGIEDEKDIYQEISNFKAEKKRSKKEAHDAARLEEREELMEMESLEGPRSVSRQILKNKGLTPKRSKVNRNPRVKKKMQYEKAKKKVASQQRVFKGGAATLGNEGYTGEKTGISRRVVKSVKL